MAKTRSKMTILSALSKIKVPLSTVYNRAYLTLVEREKKRVEDDKAKIADIIAYNDAITDPEQDEKDVAVLREYEEPTVKETLSTSLAILSLEEFLNPIFQKVANVLRPLNDTSIDVSLEATETEYNEHYPETGNAIFHAHITFPSHKMEPVLDEGGNPKTNLVGDVNKPEMVEVSQVDEVLGRLEQSVGFNFVIQ